MLPALNAAAQESVLTGLFKRREFGPTLGRPHVDTLAGSKKLNNLKELRIQHNGKPYRIFFAFDPQRQAVVLCGGNKAGNKRFYETLIPIAEKEFLNYLNTMR